MDEKENTLVEMVLAGNPGAFETLVKPYRRTLLGLSVRLLGNEEDAKEAAQEALLKAYRYLKGFDRNQSFRNWLTRILVNSCRESSRHARRTLSLAESASVIEPAAGPAARYQQKEFRSRLGECLAVLSERERAVFVLRDLEERNIAETAGILGVSSISVRVHLSRARTKIKEEILKRFPEIVGGSS